MAKVLTEKQAKALMLQTGGAIFAVTFVKKDKSVRDMNCRLNVQKYLKGGKNNAANHDNLVTVYEMAGQAKPLYKNVNVNTLLALTVDQKDYVVRHDFDIIS